MAPLDEMPPNKSHISKEPPDVVSGGADKSPKNENESLSEEVYDRTQRVRRSDFKGHVHKVCVGALYTTSITYGLLALVWIWHLVLPIDCHFMPPENQATLRSLLFGTIIGGLASQFANKIFSR